MKSILLYINKYLFTITLIINAVIIYHKLNFFDTYPVIVNAYIIFMGIALLSSLLFGNKAWYIYPRQLILWIHVLLHGLFLLTFPMGTVFALIASYVFTLKVWLIFYLPSGLAFLLNMYVIKSI